MFEPSFFAGGIDGVVGENNNLDDFDDFDDFEDSDAMELLACDGKVAGKVALLLSSVEGFGLIRFRGLMLIRYYHLRKRPT